MVKVSSFRKLIPGPVKIFANYILGILYKYKTAINLKFGLGGTKEPFLIDDPSLVFRGNPRYPGHDINGFRNRKVPCQVDVLAVGDSQVYGITVSSKQSWPHVLGEMTRLRVYNASIGGWGVPQFGMMAEQQLYLKPKNVLIGIYTGQSIYKSLIYILKSTSNYSKSYWRNGYASLPLIDFSYYWDNKNATIEKILKSNSSISRAQALAICASNGVLDCNRAQIGNARFYLEDTFRFLIQNLEHPAVSAALEISKEALIKIREMAHASNVKISIILIPTKEYLVYQHRNDAQVENIETLIRLGRNEEKLLDDLGIFCTDNDIICYKMSDYLTQHLEEGIYWQDSDDGHPNALGCHYIASYLAENIFAWAPESVK